MEFLEIINKLTPHEYYDDQTREWIMGVDYLFVLLADEPDDNNLMPIIDDLLNRSDQGACKLRGSGNMTEFPSCSNSKNNLDWFRGYVFAVSDVMLKDFESALIVHSLSHSLFRVSRIDVKDELFLLAENKKTEQRNHFNNLFDIE